MTRDDEYDWIDDAFDESKPDPLAKNSAEAGRDYDWIDDAFDDAKQDPLAGKGMVGCSRIAVVVCVIGVLVILALLALIFHDLMAPLLAGSAL